jgi:hypothetical protein
MWRRQYKEAEGVSGDEGPRARSAQGIGAIASGGASLGAGAPRSGDATVASRRYEADAQPLVLRDPMRRPKPLEADALSVTWRRQYKEAEGVSSEQGAIGS